MSDSAANLKTHSTELHPPPPPAKWRLEVWIKLSTRKQQALKSTSQKTKKKYRNKTLSQMSTPPW